MMTKTVQEKVKLNYNIHDSKHAYGGSQKKRISRILPNIVVRFSHATSTLVFGYLISIVLII